MAEFTNLPWELLQFHMFCYVSVQEFQNCRLVCKAWNEFYLTEQNYWKLNCKLPKQLCDTILYNNIDWRDYYVSNYFLEKIALKPLQNDESMDLNFHGWQDESHSYPQKKFKGFFLEDEKFFSSTFPSNGFSDMLNNVLVPLPNQHQIAIVGGCKQETEERPGPMITIFDFASESIVHQTDIEGVDLNNYLETQQPHPKLWRHTCIFYSDSLYIFAGTFSDQGIKIKYNTIFQYNLSSKQFSKIQYQQPASQIPCSRSDHCACVVGNRMYIFGGSNIDMQSMNDMYYFDLDSHLWYPVEQKGSIPPTQASASLFYVEHNQCLVLRGGSGIKNQRWGDSFPSVYLFHIPSQTWLPFEQNITKEAPRAGAFAGCIVIGKYYLLSMGGNECSKTSSEAFVFDLVRCSWHNIQSLSNLFNSTCLKLAMIDLSNCTNRQSNEIQGQSVEKEEPFLFLYGGYRGLPLNFAGKISASWLQRAKDVMCIFKN